MGVLLVVIGVGLFLEWYRKRFGPLVLSTVLRVSTIVYANCSNNLV